ncbi:MAG: hypothetical protein RMJ56_07975 [Gemmataceae bacterium]|nr:hypothetical protein [Gemmata sp.]MDW8197529.1 hypothetical protein [Gemmataceae bacterium]
MSSISPAIAPSAGTDAEREVRSPLRRAREAPISSRRPLLLWVLAGYAILATAVAVYGWFFKTRSSPLHSDHPLSTIPDTFGEFDPAVRKKVSQFKFRTDGELPPQQRAKLGETIHLGQLDIVPLEIVKRPLTLTTEAKDGETRNIPLGNALVMTLQIVNTSHDVIIYPLDPALTRKAVGYDQPLTRLVVNKDLSFAGGAVVWPFRERILRQYEVQQKNDFVPLEPGERRKYVVFTDANPEIIKSVKQANQPLQWRVHIRRGLIEWRGREIPVTAIIGVDFSAQDVKGL